MKKFMFVSDFDGTMTSRDFYLMVMDRYQRDWVSLEEALQHGKITTFTFLAEVFRLIGVNESDIERDILTIPFDDSAAGLIDKVLSQGGDFTVLSAGADYYIKKVLAEHGVTGVSILANKGIYENQGIKMTPIDNPIYHSPLYGVDKGAVIRDLKTKYEKVFFAGDSRPDLSAALVADKVFARGELAMLLQQEKKDFISFASFNDILQHLS